MGGGHRPRHAFLVVAHAVSGRGLLTATALSVEALGRVVPGLDPRIDIGHAVTALGVSGRGLLTDTAPAVSVRIPMPVGGCGAVVRDRTLSRIARVTARGQACDYLLLLPACGPWKQDGWPDVGPRRVWRPLSLSLLWPGAAAGVPPVLEGHPLPLSRLFFAGACQVLHGLVWLLFPGSTWSLGGCDRFCSSVGGCRVPVFDCCWGGHFLCCDCDACWGWRFCLLLPLLVLACLVTSSVRACPALAGIAVGRLVMGPMDVLRALQRKVSFFCSLFASSGEALSLFHRFV